MDPVSLSYPAALLGGVVIGLLLAIFGGGGSVLATPLLIYLVGITNPHMAIGTSAAAVAVNAATGLLVQARAGQVKWPCALVFGLAGLTGALVGAYAAKQIDGSILLIWFAFAMALVGLSMLVPRKTDGDASVHLTNALVVKLAPMGAATGLAAGFFGIGGGFLIVPGLMAATGMTMANAAASSLVSVVLFGAATSASYAFSGLVHWPVFATLVVGGAIGSVLAIPISGRLAKQAAMARTAFALMVIATAAYVGWRALNWCF